MGKSQKGLSRSSGRSKRGPAPPAHHSAATGAGQRRKWWFLFPALLLATLAAYQPAWHGGTII